MPTDAGHAQTQLLRHAGLKSVSIRSKGHHGAHSAGELKHQDTFPALIQPVDSPLQLVGPDGGLVAESDGQGLDIMGTPHHRGIRIALTQMQNGVPDGQQLGPAQLEHFLHCQHEGSVHHVLGGGPQVDVLAALRPGRHLQQTKHGHHGVPGLLIKFVVTG